MPQKNKKSIPQRVNTATGVKRHNIALPEDSRVKGEELAKADRRSFSNLLAVLIDNEWMRRRVPDAVTMPQMEPDERR